MSKKNDLKMQEQLLEQQKILEAQLAQIEEHQQLRQQQKQQQPKQSLEQQLQQQKMLEQQQLQQQMLEQQMLEQQQLEQQQLEQQQMQQQEQQLPQEQQPQEADDVFTVKNLKETKKLAHRFASSLNGGEVVLLVGEMGSGKTTFTKEVFRYLGYKGIVNSPTFTIMQEYHVRKFSLLHYDLYRIENPEESYNFGIEDNIKNRDINTILFVEWPERITKFLKGDFIVVQIAKTGEESRSFSISYQKI